MALKTGVIYLQKDKLQMFSPYLGNILELRFSPEMIRDLDVINSELLENQIKFFVTNGKIAPCNLLFVLADNAYFTKDFLQPAPSPKSPATPVQSEVTQEVLQQQADQFIEHVPFDNVVSKTLPLKNGIKVCATNKDFYEAIAIAFEHLGFTIVSVIPGLVLGNGVSARPVMDPPMANMVIQKANTFRQYDMLNQQVYQPTIKQDAEEVDEVELERQQAKKPNKKRLFALVGVFASLLIVLVIVYVQSQTPPTPPKQPALASSNPTTAPAVVQPTTPVATTSTASLNGTPNPQEMSTLSVQIVNASSSATTAETLREKMNTYKFKSVTVQPQSPVGSANTIVSFSGNTPQDVRNLVLDEVRKLKSNITVQDKQDNTYDITILLGE